MRVLLLITDLLIGGTPTVVRELSWRLCEAGLDVQVACLSEWGPTAEQIRSRGVPVTALNARGAGDFTVFTRLARFIREQRIEVVMSFLVHANVAATVAKLTGGFRLIQSIQTTQSYPRWHWWLQGIVQLAAERIVVPSHSVAEMARSRCSIPASKIVVIPNAVELSEFAVERIPAETARRVGFIGRLDPIKRVDDLIEAMAMLPEEFRLDIWGTGGEEDRLKNLGAARLGGRCQFHGAISRPQEALAQTDVLVLPSDAEGFGLVLIEAMAAGVPVIGTDVPGIREVLTDGRDGLLVRRRAPWEIATAIQRINSDDQLRRMLKEQARQTVSGRFNWASVLPLYLRLIRAESAV